MDDPHSRRLIVMRHAKSSWKTDAPSDHARPLNKRGRRDAPRVARKLAELGWIPQLVLSSDSQRTRETWDLMRNELEEEIDVEFLPELYHSGVEALTDALLGLAPTYTTVLALGHNPGWEAAVANFCGRSIEMTTANAALLEGAGKDWAEAIHQTVAWRLHEVVRPREL